MATASRDPRCVRPRSLVDATFEQIKPDPSVSAAEAHSKMMADIRRVLGCSSEQEYLERVLPPDMQESLEKVLDEVYSATCGAWEDNAYQLTFAYPTWRPGPHEPDVRYKVEADVIGLAFQVDSREDVHGQVAAGLDAMAQKLIAAAARLRTGKAGDATELSDSDSCTVETATELEEQEPVSAETQKALVRARKNLRAIRSLLCDEGLETEGRAVVITEPELLEGGVVRSRVEVSASFELDWAPDPFWTLRQRLHDFELPIYRSVRRLFNLRSRVGDDMYPVQQANSVQEEEQEDNPPPAEWTPEQMANWRRLAGTLMAHSDPEEFFEVTLAPPNKYHDRPVITFEGNQEYVADTPAEVGELLRDFVAYFTKMAESVEAETALIEGKAVMPPAEPETIVVDEEELHQPDRVSEWQAAAARLAEAVKDEKDVEIVITPPDEDFQRGAIQVSFDTEHELQAVRTAWEHLEGEGKWLIELASIVRGDAPKAGDAGDADRAGSDWEPAAIALAVQAHAKAELSVEFEIETDGLNPAKMHIKGGEYRFETPSEMVADLYSIAAQFDRLAGCAVRALKGGAS